MLKKIMQEFKKIIFKEHKYTNNCIDVIKLKNISTLTNYKYIYFSMHYNDIYRDLLYELKYRKCTYVSDIISDIVYSQIKYLIEKENIHYIIPVPLTKKRLLKRGFNQTELILKSLGLEYITIKRIKETHKMSKLKNRSHRKINILKSFDVNGLNLENKNILIFDDVITTGSTVDEIKRNIENTYPNTNVLVYAIAVSNKIIR